MTATSRSSSCSAATVVVVPSRACAPKDAATMTAEQVKKSKNCPPSLPSFLPPLLIVSPPDHLHNRPSTLAPCSFPTRHPLLFSAEEQEEDEEEKKREKVETEKSERERKKKLSRPVSLSPGVVLEQR